MPRPDAPGRQRQRGAALIEFALLLPFLILILIGMSDISALLSQQLTLTHVCREAAGFVSRGASFAETFAAIDHADGNLDLDGPNGEVIITEVNTDEDGYPVIVAQASVGGLGIGSSIGSLGSSDTAPAIIPNGMALPEGMVMTVVEVFSRQEHLFGGLATGGDHQITLSSRASF